MLCGISQGDLRILALEYDVRIRSPFQLSFLYISVPESTLKLTT